MSADTPIYSTLRWRVVRSRALRRDGHRCTVSRWFGGSCSATLHVHHIVPVRDGGAAYDVENLATVCAVHHPQWEALRRSIVRRKEEPVLRCPHFHRTAEGRRQCEARMARARSRVAA